ncbi:hypothetical protein ACINKY_19070 [Paenibacillus illinoisensis]|uniref:HTH araC/xylS-type domain-containing protein n=1 Tax=Paenibacillus illinoisensis TaxID=59845 RepID=A0ABW8HXX1_9BACL
MSSEVRFNTPDYFSRRFAEYYGHSPMDYRKQFRKMNFD